MGNIFSVTTNKKNGSEKFSYNNNDLGTELIDFWSWSSSDLLNNALRGKLAEYIVAKALGVDNNFRIEWDEYDIMYNNCRIEVKSGAYIQSWEQNDYSKIIFSIRPTQEYNGTKFKRHNDIYVFSILSHKDVFTINPLKLEQWDFYIISTKVLNERLENQKSMSLNTLLSLNPVKCNFKNLKEGIDTLNKELV